MDKKDDWPTKLIKLTGVLVGTAGFGWLVWMDWRIAVAVYLMMCGDKMANDR